jgi:two-component system, response regulator
MIVDKVDIVLVEDNPDDAELVIRALRKSGIKNSLVHLKDGEQALNFLFCEGPYEDHHLPPCPRLILLDIKMPKVDGLEVLRRVKSDKRLRVIPVVLLTSSKEDKDIHESYTLGANSYVVKPVEFEKLTKTVQGLGLYWLFRNQPCHL